jgi:hypothetical protein
VLISGIWLKQANVTLIRVLSNPGGNCSNALLHISEQIVCTIPPGQPLDGSLPLIALFPPIRDRCDEFPHC